MLGGFIMHEKHHHHTKTTVNCAVITVSDTRTEETDQSGKQMVDMLQSAGHSVTFYKIVADEKAHIQQVLQEATASKGVEAVLINGGTGIAERDVTIEAIQPLFTKEIPGFGELFRLLSFQFDIGTASMLSRATSGVVNRCVVFSTPGSTKAVKLAMEKLILPELGHAVSEVKKDLPAK